MADLLGLTDFHACYYAQELTRRFPSDAPEKLTSALLDAQVDLNPHQIEAALFAFKSPFSKGCILADEVGLGKTIEAGIVISQKWAEKRRRILIICPSSLRMQWSQELAEKFHLAAEIIDSNRLKALTRTEQANPFEQDAVVLCSFEFARRQEAPISALPWDLVVIDEAHRLRNVYKKDNRIGKSIMRSTASAPKLLLTATPLQNSLLELFGLVSLVDEHVFGDVRSFKAQYTSGSVDYENLRRRIAPFCKRTLRREVQEYVRYTQRISLTQEFTPSPKERELYESISAYLQREKLYALPTSQRQLITLVLRKLLASSSFAITGTLESLVARLEDQLKANQQVEDLFYSTLLKEDYEPFEEDQEAWDLVPLDQMPDPLSLEDKASIQTEVEELQGYLELARSIEQNQKGTALLTALSKAFAKLSELGAPQKALIFTESRRTQAYLYQMLEEAGYGGGVVVFNGQNDDEKSKEIYRTWKERHQGTDKISGSASADRRQALVDHFKEKSQIMIATEAGAEGVNLQFCSLVVNYDLPWNPQRIEQRIGRCHRYGQKFDVVVVNFLDRTNQADQRVFELLDQKFQLFQGVFGVSDEVLGAIESGVDFEKRIVAIYQSCRSAEEINQAFDTLQKDLEEKIAQDMLLTRSNLLENFDQSVGERFRFSSKQAQGLLDHFESWTWKLTEHFLEGQARFGPGHEFELERQPFDGLVVPLGRYRLGKGAEAAYQYRPHHPLAQKIFELGRDLRPEAARVKFQLTDSGLKVSALEPWLGQSGGLQVELLQVDSAEEEDFLLLSGYGPGGLPIEPEALAGLFYLPGNLKGAAPELNLGLLVQGIEAEESRVLAQIEAKNSRFFDEEMTKLDGWAQDRKEGLEIQLDKLEQDIGLKKNEARRLLDLEKKVAARRLVSELEKKRDQLRQNLFTAQDEVEAKKDELLDQVEERLKARVERKFLFRLGWELK
ncbi:MAG: SNF2-related protein [bacterium]|nr:SNF2-related protein [bacterium]